jgi:hypothetical protein
MVRLEFTDGNMDGGCKYIKYISGRLQGVVLQRRINNNSQQNILCYWSFTSRSRWPRGLRHELFSLARMLGSWVRIPLKAWMSVCVCVRYRPCDGLITCPRSPIVDVKRLRNWRRVQGPTKGCRAVDEWMKSYEQLPGKHSLGRLRRKWEDNVNIDYDNISYCKGIPPWRQSRQNPPKRM